MSNQASPVQPAPKLPAAGPAVCSLLAKWKLLAAEHPQTASCALTDWLAGDESRPTPTELAR